MRKIRKNGTRGYKIRRKMVRFKNSLYNYGSNTHVIPYEKQLKHVINRRVVPLTARQWGSLLLKHPHRIHRPITKRIKYNRFLFLRRQLIGETIWKRNSRF